MAVEFRFGLALFALIAMVGVSSCAGQTSPQSPASSPDAQPTPTTAPSLLGTVHGTVVDQSGAVVSGARVTLKASDPSKAQQAVTAADGKFFFANVAPGPYQLTVASAGFAPQTSSGTLLPGEIHLAPDIALAVATDVTEVQVALTRSEVAEEEVKVEEKQRVFGVFPNFYVSFAPNPAPLGTKQKFELAWKTVIDPVTFGLIGGIAGIQQADNASTSGYGQGAQGYAKRYGANYADLVTGTFIGAAILPSLLKQDPRYFYKGTGTRSSRAFYAIAFSVACKGDNGHWQPNYSNVLGSLAAGGISNLYYPAQNRNGAGLTFENAAIGIGATAAANLIEEFFMKRLTSNVPERDRSKP